MFFCVNSKIELEKNGELNIFFQLREESMTRAVTKSQWKILVPVILTSVVQRKIKIY